MNAPVLALAGITKDYPGEGPRASRRALAALDLEIGAGEIVGLLGSNGSGKSTALKIAAGLVRPSEGTGCVVGHALGSSSAKRRTGYWPERGGLPNHLTAREALEAWWAMGRTSRDDAMSPAPLWLERVGLVEAADQRIATFSKGMFQRLGLAQALMLEPDLVLLDEPFSGVDPIGVDVLVGLIREQASKGTAVLLSSHLLHRVEEVCDAVVLLAEGKTLARGTLTELLGEVPKRQRGLDDLYRERLEEGAPE